MNEESLIKIVEGLMSQRQILTLRISKLCIDSGNANGAHSAYEKYSKQIECIDTLIKEIVNKTK